VFTIISAIIAFACWAKMAAKNECRFDESEFEDHLKETSAYFSKMLNLIPAKFYLVEEDHSNSSNQKYMKNKRGKTPKQDVKEASKKAKRLKLNPTEYKSIEELQKEKELAEKREQSKFLADTMDSTAGHVQISNVKSTTLDDLRERVQNKLLELKAKRGTKKQQGNERSTKGRKKNQKRNRRVKLEKAATNKLSDPIAKKPSVTDENGRVVFSKFDFIDPNEPQIEKRSKKDLQKMLAKAERQKKKLEQLSKTDRHKREEAVTWKKALSKVKGEKQHDDPGLIKKTIKRREKKKKKSQKEWKARVEQVEQQKQRKQETRTKHIKERVERKKLKKKGKRKPGF
jgi:hypothetical protein